jgi:UDP-N-acetylglucosamine diphosphorylase/glucosamine-1-phosphate N-acetyltransferase
MQTLVLVDLNEIRQNLLPFTFVRPVSEIRVGILRIREKWEKELGTTASWMTESYLKPLYPEPAFDAPCLLVNSSLLPDAGLIPFIQSAQDGFCYFQGGQFLFGKVKNLDSFKNIEYVRQEYSGSVRQIQFPWDIFGMNGAEIRHDFERIQAGSKSEELKDEFTRVYNPKNLWLGKHVKCRAAVLNAEDGPIVIGDNVEIQEGAVVRGPVYIGDGAVINMGAKIRPDTTIGPLCKVGGELSNVVFFGHSNKAHDGFLGNSVIAEWCNLGADTNTSNLKNNYQPVSIYSYAERGMVNTGQIFCGLLMGDHCKTGINSMFNTGTVMGVAVNVYDSSFPPKFIPSFSWGTGHGGFETYKFEKFLETERLVMARRKKELSQAYLDILHHLFKERQRPSVTVDAL